MENNTSKNKAMGTSSIAYGSPVLIMGSGSVVGQMEDEGPLAGCFDKVSDDKNDMFGEDSWEKAESALQKEAVALTLSKTCAAAGDIRFLYAGDLLGQNIASSFGLVDYQYSAVWTVRRLLYLRGIVEPWQYERGGRLCGPCYEPDIESFCECAEGVPLSVGVRWTETAVRFVDSDWKRRIFIAECGCIRKVGVR